jgi:hypothetical protein
MIPSPYIILAKAVGDTGYVLLSDGDEEVLELMRQNCSLNRVENNTNCCLLRWPATATDVPDTLRPTEGVFDVIVGSDIIGYGSCSTAFDLLATVATLLRKDDDVDIKLLDSVAAAGGPEAIQASMPAEAGEAVPTGDGRGWCQLGCNGTDGGRKGTVFVLGYTRRLTRDAYDVNHVLNFANAIGLDWCVAEDCVMDIFGNRTDEMTMCVEHCVFLFTWMKRKD